MIRIWGVFLLLLLGTGYGCSSMPTRVDEAWLVDATTDDEKRITDCEESIIKARRDLESARKRRQVAQQQLSVANEKTRATQVKMQALKEEEKLYEMNQDQEKLGSVKEELRKNSIVAATDKSFEALASVFLEYTEVQEDVRTAELNVKMAMLDLEKARIAERWHQAHDEPRQEQSWYQKLLPESGFSLADYEKYHAKQAERKSELLKKRAAVLIRLRKAIDDYTAASGEQTPKWVVYEE